EQPNRQARIVCDLVIGGSVAATRADEEKARVRPIAPDHIAGTESPRREDEHPGRERVRWILLQTWNPSDVTAFPINESERPIELSADEPRASAGLRHFTATVVVLVPRCIGQQMLIQHEACSDAGRLRVRLSRLRGRRTDIVAVNSGDSGRGRLLRVSSKAACKDRRGAEGVGDSHARNVWAAPTR